MILDSKHIERFLWQLIKSKQIRIFIFPRLISVRRYFFPFARFIVVASDEILAITRHTHHYDCCQLAGKKRAWTCYSFGVLNHLVGFDSARCNMWCDCGTEMTTIRTEFCAKKCDFGHCSVGAMGVFVVRTSNNRVCVCVCAFDENVSLFIIAIHLCHCGCVIWLISCVQCAFMPPIAKHTFDSSRISRLPPYCRYVSKRV